MTGRSLLVVALTLGFAIPSARAQSAASGKWEVEAHGGGLWSSASTDGSAGTMPTATPFTTTFGFPSRRESSWFFGDGPSLLNSVNAALRANGQIASLDSVLTAAGGTRGNGGSAGFRVARRFGSRYAAEFALDYAKAPLEFAAKTVDGIESTRASFITAWNGLLATGPFATPKVTATADLRRSGGNQLLTTGVVTVDLVTHGALVPYVAGGAGVVNNRGDAPAATLTGNYTFLVGGLFPINETDKVTIRLAPRSRETVGVFGGGVRYAVSSRWGIRGDVRALAGGGKVDTVVDAAPGVTAATPTFFISSATNPSVQFSNNPAGGVQSTLGGPAISGLRTFTGSGSAIRTSVTGGVYFRF